MKTLVRTLFSASLLLIGYYLGSYTREVKKFSPICATFAERNMELEVSAAYILSSDHEIVGMLSAEGLEEMKSDTRLVFHACPK